MAIFWNLVVLNSIQVLNRISTVKIKTSLPSNSSTQRSDTVVKNTNTKNNNATDTEFRVFKYDLFFERLEN